MALDMTKVLAQKERVEEKLTRGGGTLGARFWRPADGENKIRIMPSWATEGEFAGQFWREVAQHWNVSDEQKGPVLCPKKTPDLDGDCPICEFVDALRADKSNVEAQELAKEIRAKTTYMLNVVDSKDATYTASDVADFKKNRPDQDCPFEVNGAKIQVYACPSTIFDQILGTITTNQLDITDLENGHDLVVKKFANKDRFKTRYEVNLIVSASASDVTTDTVLPALDKTGFVMKYEDMVNLLSDGAGSKVQVASLPADTTPIAAAPSADLAAELQAALRG